jgi:hypothetical protein
MTRQNSQLHLIKGFTSGRRGVSNTTVKTKVLRVMTLVPHISPGNLAWRKQISATNTRIYQFTGDKTGDRQNVFMSWT